MVDAGKPVFCDQCGKECERIFTPAFPIDGNADVADYDVVRTNKPKWLRFKDGRRERFNDLKHGHKKGGASDIGKNSIKK